MVDSGHYPDPDEPQALNPGFDGDSPPLDVEAAPVDSPPPIENENTDADAEQDLRVHADTDADTDAEAAEPAEAGPGAFAKILAGARVVAVSGLSGASFAIGHGTRLTLAYPRAAIATGLSVVVLGGVLWLRPGKAPTVEIAGPGSPAASKADEKAPPEETPDVAGQPGVDDEHAEPPTILSAKTDASSPPFDDEDEDDTLPSQRPEADSASSSIDDVSLTSGHPIDFPTIPNINDHPELPSSPDLDDDLFPDPVSRSDTLLASAAPLLPDDDLPTPAPKPGREDIDEMAPPLPDDDDLPDTVDTKADAPVSPPTGLPGEVVPPDLYTGPDENEAPDDLDLPAENPQDPKPATESTKPAMEGGLLGGLGSALALPVAAAAEASALVDDFDVDDLPTESSAPPIPTNPVEKPPVIQSAPLTQAPTSAPAPAPTPTPAPAADLPSFRSVPETESRERPSMKTPEEEGWVTIKRSSSPPKLDDEDLNAESMNGRMGRRMSASRRRDIQFNLDEPIRFAADSANTTTTAATATVAAAATAATVTARARRTSEDRESGKMDTVLHTVQRGENFWTISRTHYASGRYYQALHKANSDQFETMEQLYVGAVIRIPPPEDLDPAFIEAPGGRSARNLDPTSPEPSNVQAALPEGTRQIQRSNRSAGVLDLPYDDPSTKLTSGRGERRRSTAREELRAPTTVSRRTKTNAVHKVRPRETLRTIARDRLGDSRRAREILELNRDVIDNPGVLVVGQVLTLPDDAE